MLLTNILIPKQVLGVKSSSHDQTRVLLRNIASSFNVCALVRTPSTYQTQINPMASVNIPFNLDARQIGQKNQDLSANNGNQQLITNFYNYQDPSSGLMPQSRIENEAQEQELCFKKCLMILIIALSSVTLVKSCAINCIKLSRNIALNFQLKNHEKKLKIAKAQIQAKIKANKSFHGMKKIIKEEIKALDANEILVRLEK